MERPCSPCRQPPGRPRAPRPRPKGAGGPGAARALALAAALSAAGAACARNPEAASAPAADLPAAIAVGVLPADPRYQEVVDGVQLAVDRLNEGKGRRFTVRVPRPGSLSNARLARQFVDDAEVLGVVGGADNGAVQETLGIYADSVGGEARALPLVSPAAAASRLSGVNPWFFRVTPNDKDVARFAARWMRDSLPARRTVVVYRNDPVGRDWSATFADAFARSGGVVLARRPYLAGITEWEAYARLLAKLAPEAVLFAGAGDDLLALKGALTAIGLDLPLVGSPDVALADGQPGADGVRYLTVQGGASAEARTFTQRYRARRGRAPTMAAALAYDAALVIGRAVQRGGGTRPQLREALEGTGNGAPSVQGALGLIAFRYNHDIRGRTVSVTQARGGAPAE
jgi:branched-chain amino acid transport system substrate-binding protein